MRSSQKVALAYTREATSEIGEPIPVQKAAIADYAQENGYVIVHYVEHADRPGNVFDLEWLSEILKNDSTIRYILMYSSDRFCSDTNISQKLEKILAQKYNILFDAVIKNNSLYPNRTIPLSQ